VFQYVQLCLKWKNAFLKVQKIQIKLANKIIWKCLKLHSTLQKLDSSHSFSILTMWSHTFIIFFTALSYLNLNSSSTFLHCQNWWEWMNLPKLFSTYSIPWMLPAGSSSMDGCQWVPVRWSSPERFWHTRRACTEHVTHLSPIPTSCMIRQAWLLLHCMVVGRMGGLSSFCTKACVPFLRLDIKFHRETELASIASAEDECKWLLLHHCWSCKDH
jgi:hypothetical protein